MPLPLVDCGGGAGQGILTEREGLLELLEGLLDLLELTSSGKVLLILKIVFLPYKTSYPYKEVNCTEASISVRVPWAGAELK